MAGELANQSLDLKARSAALRPLRKSRLGHKHNAHFKVLREPFLKSNPQNQSINKYKTRHTYIKTSNTNFARLVPYVSLLVLLLLLLFCLLLLFVSLFVVVFSM